MIKYPALALAGLVQVGFAGDPLEMWVSSSAPPTTNVLRGVTYGNGQFVAVGGGENVYLLNGRGVILTSPDGLTWTSRDIGLTNGLAAVAYGNGRFVAVGRGAVARIVSSSDGINWTQQDYVAGVGSWLTGVTFGNDEFTAVGGFNPPGIIVGSSPFVLTSSDGMGWSRLTNFSVGLWGELSGVAYGAGQFAAVGGWEGFSAVTWPGPYPWPAVGTNSDLRPLSGVAYGADRFIGVGGGSLFDYGIIVSFENGVANIQRYRSFSNYLSAVTYAARQFVAVGAWLDHGQPTNGLIMTSPDGITWTPRDPGTTNGLYGVTYGNGHFIAVGANGTIVRSGEIVSLTPPALDGGMAHGAIGGIAGKPYGVDASTNLMDWLSLTNVTTDTTGTAVFFDPAATNFNSRFYRAVAP